jgi:UDPglucose--hexose-1-phosphate uridylyltransferase
MSELRHDPLSGLDVIVAAGRAARPTTFTPPASDAADAASCPFCPGHEAETPPEIARTGGGPPGTPGWRVRVFPNLYPIVETHEVVVLSPDEHRSYADLDDAEAVEVVTMWRDRVHFHLERGHEYGVAIVNHGRDAGASIAHPHAQVFALDFVPDAVGAALARVRAAGDDLVHADLRSVEPFLDMKSVSAWCPFASTSPYLVRVAHADAGARFDLADDTAVAEVAVTTRDALLALRTAVGDAPYNLVVHTAPRTGERFHWYVEIAPRLTVVAGFERATGILVNTVPPDVAADELRDAAG